eukprot:ctg_1387.g447
MPAPPPRTPIAGHRPRIGAQTRAPAFGANGTESPERTPVGRARRGTSRSGAYNTLPVPARCATHSDRSAGLASVPVAAAVVCDAPVAHSG